MERFEEEELERERVKSTRPSEDPKTQPGHSPSPPAPPSSLALQPTTAKDGTLSCCQGAPVADTPRPQTTSISSLPPELLLRILELTTEDERLAPYFVQSSHDRLRLFSLVARAWKAPAQTLLWRRVVLKDRRLVERWLECPVLGEHRTMELSIQRSHHERLRFLELRVRQQGSSDWARLDAVVNFTEVLDAALGAVRGLEVLRLAGCELGLRSLGLPNLAGA